MPGGANIWLSQHAWVINHHLQFNTFLKNSFESSWATPGNPLHRAPLLTCQQVLQELFDARARAVDVHSQPTSLIIFKRTQSFQCPLSNYWCLFLFQTCSFCLHWEEFNFCSNNNNNASRILTAISCSFYFGDGFHQFQICSTGLI